MASHTARTVSERVVARVRPSNRPWAAGSTNGARSPAPDRKGSAVTPFAPGGLRSSRGCTAGARAAAPPRRGGRLRDRAAPPAAGQEGQGGHAVRAGWAPVEQGVQGGRG